MTDVFCDNAYCKWNQGGCCVLDVISICDGECEDFEDYHDDIEWQTPYWKRMGTVGKQYKVKYFGKRIEIGEIAVFVDTKQEDAMCTEETSGLGAGCLCDLNEERVEKIKSRLATNPQDLPPLESLPTAVYKNGKIIPVEKKEAEE